MIPKILHLYWGRNRPLSYLHWLTAKTFSNLNLGWKINVYYPEKPVLIENWITGEHLYNCYNGKDWFYELGGIKNLRLKKINNDTGLPEVIHSDYIRWKLLAEHGGLWSDFDILYIRPMIDLLEYRAVLSSWKAPSGITINPVAFMASIPNHPLFQDAFRIAKLCINDHGTNYQMFGRLLLDKVLSSFEYDHTDLDHKTVYPITAHHLEDCWKKTNLIFNKTTIGIHWFAGAKISAKFIAEITNENKIKKFKDINLFKNYEI